MAKAQSHGRSPATRQPVSTGRWQCLPPETCACGQRDDHAADPSVVRSELPSRPAIRARPGVGRVGGGCGSSPSGLVDRSHATARAAEGRRTRGATRSGCDARACSGRTGSARSGVPMTAPSARVWPAQRSPVQRFAGYGGREHRGSGDLPGKDRTFLGFSGIVRCRARSPLGSGPRFLARGPRCPWIRLHGCPAEPRSLRGEVLQPARWALGVSEQPFRLRLRVRERRASARTLGAVGDAHLASPCGGSNRRLGGNP